MRLSLTRPKSPKHQSDSLPSYLRDCKPAGERGRWNGSEVELHAVIQNLHMQIDRVATGAIGLRECAKNCGRARQDSEGLCSQVEGLG
jgi:hypothetical protein